MAMRASRSSMGGAVRLKRSNSGSTSASAEIEEEEEEGCSPSSHDSKRRKSVVWESSPKRNTGKRTFFTSDPASEVAESNDSSLNIDIASNRSSSSRSGSAGSGVEYRQRLRSSSSDAKLTALKPWALEEFTLGKALGKGRFGNVYLAKQKRTNVQLAFKVLFKAPMQAAQCVNALRREVEIQSRLKHENIVGMFGYFHDAKNVYLLLEYLSGGELYKKMSKSDGFLTERTCRTYMRDIASGLGYMHERGVMHRDIKPENILIGEDGRLRLTDLGWAAHSPIHTPRSSTSSSSSHSSHNHPQGYSTQTGTGTGLRYTMCGTPEYLAPEMIAGSGHTLCVDLWALGILLYEMLYGRTPFFERQRQSSGDAEDAGAAEIEARQRMYAKIQAYKGHIAFPPLPSPSSGTNSSVVPSKIPPSFSARRTSTLPPAPIESTPSPSLSPAGQNIIMSLLRRDPCTRMTAKDIHTSDWLAA